MDGATRTAVRPPNATTCIMDGATRTGCRMTAKAIITAAVGTTTVAVEITTVATIITAVVGTTTAATITTVATATGPLGTSPKPSSSTRRRPGGGRAVVAALLLALVVSGCGGTSNDESSTTTVAYVANDDLSRYEPGTPERTVLEWWKAVQFGNPTLAHRYYAPTLGPKLAVLQSELAMASNQFTGIPTFKSAEVHGNKATLYLFATRPGSSSPGRAVSVNLIKTDGHWNLADDQLLAQVVERVEAAEKLRNG